MTSAGEAGQFLDSGMNALRDGDCTAAERAFRAVIKLFPYHPGAHQGLGKALLDQLRIPEVDCSTAMTALGILRLGYFNSQDPMTGRR